MSSDGLGTPAVNIFFSICDRKMMLGSYCDGCHNKDLQSNNVGYMLSIEEIINLVENKATDIYTTFGKCVISLIGGEPLSKLNRDFSYKIAEYFKDVYIDTIIYTWREIEDLKKENINIENYSKVVCGSYVDKLKNENYVLGSENQYIINNKYEKIIEYKEGENCNYI
jgi:organic radical activating enzyme